LLIIISKLWVKDSKTENNSRLETPLRGVEANSALSIIVSAIHRATTIITVN
jgi:hypothetical protein